MGQGVAKRQRQLEEAAAETGDGAAGADLEGFPVHLGPITRSLFRSLGAKTPANEKLVAKMAMVCSAWWQHARTLPSHRGLVPAVPLPTPESRKWQLQLIARVDESSVCGLETVTTRYREDTRAERHLVVAANTSVHDLLRAVLRSIPPSSNDDYAEFARRNWNSN